MGGIRDFLKETKDFSEDFFIDTDNLNLKTLARYGTGYDAWKAFRRFNQTDTGKLTGIIGTVIAAYYTGNSAWFKNATTSAPAEVATETGSNVSVAGSTQNVAKAGSETGSQFFNSNQVPNMLSETGTNLGNTTNTAQTGGQFFGSNQVPNMLSETGTNVGNTAVNSLGSKMLNVAKGTGSWIKDNPMMAYLMMNTAGTMLSDPIGDQEKALAKREKRRVDRINRNMDFSEWDRSKPGYKPGRISRAKPSQPSLNNPGIINRNQTNEDK